MSYTVAMHCFDFFLPFLCIYFVSKSMCGVYVCVYLCVRATVHSYESEDSFGELVLFLNHVGSWDQAQASSLASILTHRAISTLLFFPVVNLMRPYQTSSTFKAWPDEQLQNISHMLMNICKIMYNLLYYICSFISHYLFSVMA